MPPGDKQGLDVRWRCRAWAGWRRDRLPESMNSARRTQVREASHPPAPRPLAVPNTQRNHVCLALIPSLRTSALSQCRSGAGGCSTAWRVPSGLSSLANGWR
eukprot:scaffold7856_cov444-Prasinococcus_capsulatus_cf.AAC.1